MKYLHEVVKKMYRLAIKGIIFDCISKRAVEKRPEYFAVDECSLFKWLKDRFEKVVLDFSYSPHCFTVALFKEKSKWQQKWDETGGG